MPRGTGCRAERRRRPIPSAFPQGPSDVRGGGTRGGTSCWPRPSLFEGHSLAAVEKKRADGVIVTAPTGAAIVSAGSTVCSFEISSSSVCSLNVFSIIE